MGFVNRFENHMNIDDSLACEEAECITEFDSYCDNNEENHKDEFGNWSKVLEISDKIITSAALFSALSGIGSNIKEASEKPNTLDAKNYNLETICVAPSNQSLEESVYDTLEEKGYTVENTMSDLENSLIDAGQFVEITGAGAEDMAVETLEEKMENANEEIKTSYLRKNNSPEIESI